MTAPNIEAIAASLRNCSLGGRTESPEILPPAVVAENRPAVVEENVGVMVELNSEVALPYHWEQCLDLRTGELYYINWKDGTRTTEDPRLTTRCRSNYYSSEEEISDLDEEEAEEEEEEYCDAEDSSSSVGEGTEYDDFCSVNAELSSGTEYRASTSSTSAEAETSISATSGSQVLVAAGCKSCFMYFMVPKRVDACPKCGGCLLYLGRNGYF